MMVGFILTFIVMSNAVGCFSFRLWLYFACSLIAVYYGLLVDYFVWTLFYCYSSLGLVGLVQI